MAVLLAFIKVFEIPPIIPLLSYELKATYAQVGTLMTSYAAVRCLASFWVGSISDKWGSQRVIMLGLLYMGLFGTLSSLVTHFGTLLVFRVLISIGVTAVFIAGLDAISKIMSPDRVGTGIGYFNASLNIGVTATLLFTPILSDRYGWRWTVRLSSLACLALAAYLIFTLRGKNYARKSLGFTAERREGDDGHFLNPMVLLLALAMGLLLFQVYGILTWIPSYLKDVLHYSSYEVGVSSMLLGLGTIPASIVTGRLTRKVASMVGFCIGGALLSGSSILLFISWQGWSWGAIICLIGLMAWGTTQAFIPMTSLVPLTVSARNIGKALGLVFTVGYMGSVLSTYLGGYIVTKTQRYEPAFIIFGLSTFLAVLAVAAGYSLVKARSLVAGQGNS